jgi:hypothetical protein
MGNKSGNAYGLTALIPIEEGSENNMSYDKILRDKLQCWPVHEKSPMAGVPNTYLCRLYLLNDCFYEQYPAKEEHLANKYLVFSSNFYGKLEPYLEGMWNHAGETLSDLLEHCIDFTGTDSAAKFVKYIKRCQVKTSLFFNGSTDQPLKEQLKGLYLKQAFSHFAYMTQPFQSQGEEGAKRLQKAYQKFVQHCQPDNLNEPTWPVAATKLPENLENEIQMIVDSVAGEKE